MIPRLFMVVCVAKRQKFALISRSSSLIHFKILKIAQENRSLDLLGLPRTSLLLLLYFLGFLHSALVVKILSSYCSENRKLTALYGDVSKLQKILDLKETW